MSEKDFSQLCLVPYAALCTYSATKKHIQTALCILLLYMLLVGVCHKPGRNMSHFRSCHITAISIRRSSEFNKATATD